MSLLVAIALLAQVIWVPVPTGPAYLTETENQPDQLGLATQSGSYLIALGDGCDGAQPYQNVVVADVEDHAAALQLFDAVCSIQVVQRMDFTPCAVDGDGVCDSAGVAP